MGQAGRVIDGSHEFTFDRLDENAVAGQWNDGTGHGSPTAGG